MTHTHHEETTLALEDIKPYKNNPRINDMAVEPLANSMRLSGYDQYILVDEDNVILKGHTRLKALTYLNDRHELGKDKLSEVTADKVKVIKVYGLTEKEKKASRIADNKVGELAQWDPELLSIEMEDIGIDMGELGFDDTILTDEQTEIVEDDYEEPEQLPSKVKRGQIWKLGDHVLMCGDATSDADMSRLMDGLTADISFTSPPYNAHHLDIPKSAERGGGYQKDTQKKYLADNDHKSEDDYFSFIKTNLDLLLAHSKEVFYNIGVGSGSKKCICKILDTFSDNFKDFIYWKKDNPMPVIADGVMSSAVELIISFGKNGSRAFNCFQDVYFHGVIEGLSASTSNKYADIHKATFPLYLPVKIIEEFTKKGHVVLDCFGGTGTTMIACEETNRRCYMMELEPRYCDVIIDRWEKHTGKIAELIEG